LGDVAFTTVEGTDMYTKHVLPSSENVYGPFENGFTSDQASIIATSAGCTSDKASQVCA
jgi:hypothetical protein